MKGAMTMQINWLWLAIGLIPYALQRQQTKDGCLVRMQALLWRLTIRWSQGHCSWKVSLPLIEHWPHEK
jgi:hypothetical protein